MTIEYLKKDITTTKRGIIAHGVNCQGAMGAGVALALMKKWPIIRESYMRYQMPNLHLLGNVDFVDVDPANELIDDGGEGYNLVVANCWTQGFFGGDGRKYASTEAVEKCLQNVYMYADAFDLPVVMPLIGCGLAGLDWDADVEPIVSNCDAIYTRVNTTICLWG